MIYQFIKKMFAKKGYLIMKQGFLIKKYRERDSLEPLEQLFYKCLSQNFFFIQIGANDGKRFDPIHHLIAAEKENIKGMAIEPINEYFEELKITYKDFAGIKCLRKAIHNTISEMPLYTVNPKIENIPEKFKGMASFDKYNLTKDGLNDNEIVIEYVPCISLMKLIDSEKIIKVDLLQIDAEGYDLEIIKSIDFKILKPSIINFEHRWQYDLVTDTEMISVLKILISNGYKLFFNGNDCLAYL